MSSRDLATWLEIADNATEWVRLREALSLTDEFALFLLFVSDAETESSLVELLQTELPSTGRRILHASALQVASDAPIRQFMQIDARRREAPVLTTTGASRTDIEALERCRIIKSLPHMEEAVMDALKTWRMTPVQYQGRTVAVDYVIPFRFKLQ